MKSAEEIEIAHPTDDALKYVRIIKEIEPECEIKYYETEVVHKQRIA